MNKKDWQAVEQARELFNLGEQATADEIKQAYRRMCKKYRFPLKPDKDTLYDPEDWWMNRFGDDPLWGRKKR
jgi:DnaJ-class molecular chaperone